MNRTELNAKWDAYCQNFIGHEPEGFSLEKGVFDAQKKDFPSETLKKISIEDWMESLSFRGESAMSLLGPMECKREEIQEYLSFLKQGKIKMAFDYEVGKSDPLHVVRENSSFAGREIWFIGDIHGDLLAFQSAIAFINSNSKSKPIYVLLGDIFDRNDFSLNVVLAVLRLLKNSPDSVFMIAGNHDDGLSWDENGRKFSSVITPQQYTDYLNAIDDDLISSLMAEFIKVLKILPLGLVLPNGLLATHGGVPSRPDRSVKNIWEGLKPQEIKKLIADKRLEFQRNRFMGEVSSGSKLAPEFSWVEIINFSHAVESAYGAQISALLRGHDHCDLCRHEWAKSSFKGNENCRDFERVQNVLTMTTMTLMDDGEKRISGFLKREVSCPSVAHYIDGTPLPKVYTLEFSAEEVKNFSNKVHQYLGKESLAYVESHLERLQEDLEECEEDRKDNEERLNTKKPLCDEQKKAVEKANSQMATLEKELNNIIIGTERAKADIESLEAEQKATVNNRKALLEKINDSEKILKEKQKNIDECNRAIAKYNEELKNADKKDESFFEKLKKAKEKVIDFLGLSDPNKNYTPDELKNKFNKVERDTFQLQSTLEEDNEKAEKLSNQLKTIELKLNEKKNLLAILKKQKSDKEPELEKAKDSVRKETQKYNEQQNEINQYERKVKLAKDDIESIQRDIKLCNTQKEQYTRWISTQN